MKDQETEGKTVLLISARCNRGYMPKPGFYHQHFLRTYRKLGEEDSGLPTNFAEDPKTHARAGILQIFQRFIFMPVGTWLQTVKGLMTGYRS